MGFLKRQLRSLIYRIPGAQGFWIDLARRFGSEGKPDFSGWGMETHTFTPWSDGQSDALGRAFLDANTDLVEKVRAKEFVLSQFESAQDKRRLLAGLMWRHYIVFWSARYASLSADARSFNLVECGVCDGLTAYFAMRAVEGGRAFRMFLYDAWEGMKPEYLLESEKESAGSYSFLSLEQTRRNLAAFSGQTVFNRGFIPKSFESAENPVNVAWLHIDLNSAMPTLAALERFFDGMPRGGVILFDDYNWHGYQDTRNAVDKFFVGRSGILFPLPTGQAIYFKK